MITVKRIIATAALTIAAATTAAGCGTAHHDISVGTYPNCTYGVAHGAQGPQCAMPAPCFGPYQPVITSGSYLRVTADGHGVHSDADRSNYRCDNGRLVVTVPWNGSR